MLVSLVPRTHLSRVFRPRLTSVSLRMWKVRRCCVLFVKSTCGKATPLAVRSRARRQQHVMGSAARATTRRRGGWRDASGGRRERSAPAGRAGPHWRTPAPRWTKSACRAPCARRQRPAGRPRRSGRCQSRSPSRAARGGAPAAAAAAAALRAHDASSGCAPKGAVPAQPRGSLRHHVQSSGC